MRKINKYILNIIERRIKNLYKRYLMKFFIFICYLLDSKFNITGNTILYMSDMQVSASILFITTLVISALVLSYNPEYMLSDTIIETSNAEEKYLKNLKICKNNDELIASYKKYQKLQVNYDNVYGTYICVYLFIAYGGGLLINTCLNSYNFHVSIYKLKNNVF